MLLEIILIFLMDVLRHHKKYTNRILQGFEMSEYRVIETPYEKKFEYNYNAVKMTDIRMYRERL